MDLDNSYADESFEDIQSPVKKEQNVGDHDELFEDPSDDEDNGLGDLEEQDNGLGDEEEDNGLDDDEDEVKCNPEEQKFEEEGMNLDDFLKNFEGAEENDPKSKTIESDHPELRPLVGMSPPESGKKDARDIYLSKALHGSPAISGLMSAENLVHKNNKISPMANSSSENNINPLKSGGSGGKDLSSLTNRLKFVMEEEEKNAEKVNELLRQMKVNKKDEEAIVSAPKVKYPILSDSASDVANNYKKVKKLEKIAHTPPHHTGDDDENIANTRDINSFLAQVKQLKQDLKRRDERLSRITEHDALVTKKVETLTGENALLKQQLHSAQLDVETQIARADNAVLTKKKKKKLEKQAQELKNDAKAYAEENARLKERESALLEAIEEFSTQNEDLMRQLKQSLAKEAKFTSIIQNLTAANNPSNNNNTSPNIDKEKPPLQGKAHGRRNRSKTDSSVPSHSSIKLPKVPHRHNLTRNFHCFD